MAALTKDNVLYVWGGYYDWFGKFDASRPYKYLENIRSFEQDDTSFGAITCDDKLYMWGNNIEGQIGNGDRVGTGEPQLVLENVADIMIFLDITAAIKKDGYLYMWGNNYNNLINIVDEDVYVPTLIDIHR